MMKISSHFITVLLFVASFRLVSFRLSVCLFVQVSMSAPPVKVGAAPK